MFFKQYSMPDLWDDADLWVLGEARRGRLSQHQPAGPIGTPAPVAGALDAEKVRAMCSVTRGTLYRDTETVCYAKQAV